MKIRSIAAALFGLLSLIHLLPAAVSAMEIEAGYTVRAVIPENQINRDAAYFDLRMTPGQVQELTVIVENPGAEGIAVTVETVTASTNRDGNLNYSTPGTNDATIPYVFSELARPVAERLTIPAYSAAEAVVAVTMPEEEYDGLLLGSIRVVKEPDPEEELPETGIVNRYSYAVGVRLTETDREFTPTLALGRVEAALVNHKAAIVAHIRNPRPMIVEGVEADIRVYGQDGTEPVIARVQEDITLAPNTVFPLPLVDREGYGFPPGEYAADIRLVHEGEEWAFRQDFTIEPEAAEALNQNAVNQVQNPSGRDKAESPWTTIAIGAALVLVLAAVIVLRKRPW